MTNKNIGELIFDNTRNVFYVYFAFLIIKRKHCSNIVLTINNIHPDHN